MIKPRSPTLQADSLPSESPGKPTTTITHFKNIYILPNHPTLSLSHRVQKTVLYISFSFVVSYTGLLGRPRGMVWGGRREEGSAWGTNVYLWRIHFYIWQNLYNIVNLKNKIQLNKYSLRNFHIYNTVLLTMRFPGGSVVKNLPVDAGETGSIPGSGRCPGGGHSNPIQYSCLRNPMDRGAGWATVHGFRKSWT